MRLSRLTITNFRNLDGIDVELAGSPVVVGANRVGKSNLVHAIRLVLDSSLSNAARWLGPEDFSDQIGSDPIADGKEIRVSVELADFEDDPGLMATLRHAIVEGEPIRARITYRFGPKELEDGEEALSTDAYGWSILGGADEQAHRMPSELRSYLHYEYLGALRDAQADLSSWRRSPLKRLLQAAAASSTSDDLEVVRRALEEANASVAGLEAVSALAAQIGEETERLVGGVDALEPSLRVGPVDPGRLIRDLRVLLDGDAQRGLHTASLGSLNVLYLALVELELARRVEGKEIEYALISIEEPEAHLHPQLQRRAFARLQEADGPKRSTLVTTHSSHIVSVTDPRRLVVLRGTPDGTAGFSAASADLTDPQWDDVARYLDVTRAEMVFARKVLLVEGLAEQLLIPGLAVSLGVDLDGEGISVCAVGGVHFEPYVRFLRALGTPHAVITDGDPRGARRRTGERRLALLAERLDGEGAVPEELGLFHGVETFELDLSSGATDNHQAMLRTLSNFSWGAKNSGELATALEGDGLTDERLMVLINAVAKGRFAQRLVADAPQLVVPEYIRSALTHLEAGD